MEPGVRKSAGFLLKVALSVLFTISALSQQNSTPEVPAHFKLDMETAARLRPQLMAQSVAASKRYAPGRAVFDQLVAQVGAPAGITFAWQLRIVEDDQLNAYTSPDGTVYVESGLAQLAGPSTGLWAAILSHEIAHVVRRDWARRYLFQRSLESSGGAIVLGDPGIPSSGWTDSQKASEELATFCRKLEVEADRDGLMLMAHAGYHPDFVPALHHLLHAHGSGGTNRSLYAMHPCWDERDRELSRAYLEVSIEFAHRWPEWYASPGGNPPIVVFADEPKVRKTGSREWEIQIPMRCQNLAGAVEVVLRATSAQENEGVALRESSLSGSDDEIRQLTGCTSPKTTITFTLTDPSSPQQPGAQWTDVYVLDSWGAVLARADVPKLPR